jgi:hypothetical protein
MAVVAASFGAAVFQSKSQQTSQSHDEHQYAANHNERPEGWIEVLFDPTSSVEA